MDENCDTFFFQRIDANPILYDRQKDMLKHASLHSGGVLTRTEYIAKTGVSASTAGRDLSEMVLAGWLERDGPGRYVLVDQEPDDQGLHRLFHP